MKRGKKYVEAAKAVDRATLYDTNEAISLVKKAAVAKFDETIEVHIRTGCDGRHADQQIRGAVVLPHGTGKTVRVLVFAKDAKAEEAKAAGADFVGAEDLIPKIQNEGWLDFDVVVATPDMMGVVGRLGRVLGPKGLMPNPKACLLYTSLRHVDADTYYYNPTILIGTPSMIDYQRAISGFNKELNTCLLYTSPGEKWFYYGILSVYAEYKLY